MTTSPRRLPDRAARWRRAWARASLAGLLSWLGVAAEARAAPAPRVLLLDLDDGDLARRLLAELTFTGLAPIQGARHLEGSTAPDAEALVRVISERSVQIEIVDSTGHRTYSSTLRASKTETTVFPVRVVEQLRARLLDLGFELPEKPSEAAPGGPRTNTQSPVVDAAPAAAERVMPAAASAGHEEAFATPRAASEPALSPALVAGDTPARVEEEFAEAGREAAVVLWAHGGPGGQLAAGGMGPALGGTLAVGLDWGSLGLGIAASFPLSQLEVDEPPGEANAAITSVCAELRYPLWSRERWLVDAGLGAGLVVLALQAEAEPPFIARDRRLISGRYYLHAGLARELEDWLRVGVDIAAGANSPRPVLRFDEREVASWGPGFVALTLNAELRWRLNESTTP
jgi:hypothetical protein